MMFQPSPLTLLLRSSHESPFFMPPRSERRHWYGSCQGPHALSEWQEAIHRRRDWRWGGRGRDGPGGPGKTPWELRAPSSKLLPPGSKGPASVDGTLHSRGISTPKRWSRTKRLRCRSAEIREHRRSASAERRAAPTRGLSPSCPQNDTSASPENVLFVLNDNAMVSLPTLSTPCGAIPHHLKQLREHREWLTNRSASRSVTENGNHEPPAKKSEGHRTLFQKIFHRRCAALR